MPVVDVRFAVNGTVIPVDHGYHLFSAISRILPGFHGDETVGVHPISGPPARNRCQLVTERSSIGIRLSSDRLGEVMPLAGRSLDLGGRSLRIGVPRTDALEPASRLYSRLVVIKGFMEPEPFLDAAQRQLDAMGLGGKPSLVPQPHIEAANRGLDRGSHSPVLRRTIRIRDKEIVGFALRVQELTAEESIVLQEKGIGGRRRFGCGLFIPAVEEDS